MTNKKDIRTSDLDKEAEVILKRFKKKGLSVDEVKALTRVVNKKASQSAIVGTAN